MSKRQWFFLPVVVILLLIAAACTAAPSPVSTGITLQAVETDTATPGNQDLQPCAYMWASQQLPDINTQLQDAFAAAGLKGVTGWVEAYGENCVDTQTNKVISFSAMETDFHIQVETTDLKDLHTLGALVEQVLIVLDQFPPEKTPGPQPGYIGVQFTAGQDSLNLWFSVTKGISGRQQGLDGADLLNYLLKQ